MRRIGTVGTLSPAPQRQLEFERQRSNEAIRIEINAICIELLRTWMGSVAAYEQSLLLEVFNKALRAVTILKCLAKYIAQTSSGSRAHESFETVRRCYIIKTNALFVTVIDGSAEGLPR